MNALEQTQQISALSAAMSERGKNQVPLQSSSAAGQIEVTLLTGGGDKPYALGLASALSAHGVGLDFVGSNDLDVPELRRLASLNFFNLRGNQRTDVSLFQKTARILIYYLKLTRYAVTARPRIFHILWNNKFEFFDRTLLLLYYRLLGRRIVITAHNVNAGDRDANDTYLNRLTLRIQYHLADRIFVHTRRMQQELVHWFDVSATKVSVIPFGINNTVPNTALTSGEAKQKFGISPQQKTILFFGNVAPYKGLEHLITAFSDLVKRHSDCRLIIAGRTKGCAEYWSTIQEAIARDGLAGKIIQRIEYIPDEQVEEFFKAADVLVLPYTHVFQSGVLFLAYNFGLPVIASDVGSMKEDVIEGRTGFICRPRDPASLSETIAKYFRSSLFEHLEDLRSDIRIVANDRYSWDKVAEITKAVYREVLGS